MNPSKRALYAMLADAVKNTPGAVPIKKALPPGVKPTLKPTPAPTPAPPVASEPAQEARIIPTAHQIAVAVVAAARAVGVDLISVITSKVDDEYLKARTYAAFAIEQTYPGNGRVTISRWVGAKNPYGLMSLMESRRREGKLKWWDDDRFAVIIMATEEARRG